MFITIINIIFLNVLINQNQGKIYCPQKLGMLSVIDETKINKFNLIFNYIILILKYFTIFKSIIKQVLKM